MRLIDADALTKVIQQNDYMITAKHNSMAPGMFTSGIRQAVDESQTIDPVKHGKWIFKGTSTDGKKVYECSACHADIYATGNFCKECGARMDGEA